MGSDAKLIEGEGMSLPVSLDPGLFIKMRYQKTNGSDSSVPGTNKGEIQGPDEAVFLLGGRAGEHVGFFLEASLNEGLNKAVTVFSNFRMPIVYDVGPAKLNIIPFTTAEGGASFGFESLNTGAGRMIKPFEHRTDMSAQQYMGTAGMAEGVAIVAANDKGYINYSLWAPAHAGYTDEEHDNGASPGPMSNYLRIVATPNIGGFDTGFGVQLWSGTTKFADDVKIATRAWAVDAQAQGDAGGMPLGVYLTYGNANKTNAGEDANLFNSNAKDKKAWSAVAELGVLPGKATIAAGYRAGDNGAAENNKQNTMFLGATYLLAQNVKFELDYSMYSGSYYDTHKDDGNRLMTLMLAVGF